MKKQHVSLLIREAAMIMAKKPVLSDEDEDRLLTGVLDGYGGKPHADPRELLSHKMTVLVPLEGNWYRLGFLLGQTLRNNERN